MSLTTHRDSPSTQFSIRFQQAGGTAEQCSHFAPRNGWGYNSAKQTTRTNLVANREKKKHPGSGARLRPGCQRCSQKQAAERASSRPADCVVLECDSEMMPRISGANSAARRENRYWGSARNDQLPLRPFSGVPIMAEGRKFSWLFGLAFIVCLVILYSIIQIGKNGGFRTLSELVREKKDPDFSDRVLQISPAGKPRVKRNGLRHIPK